MLIMSRQHIIKGLKILGLKVEIARVDAKSANAARARNIKVSGSKRLIIQGLTVLALKVNEIVRVIG